MSAVTLFSAAALLLYQSNWFSVDQSETREQFQDFCLFCTTTHSASISNFVLWFQLSLSLINQNCAFLLRNLNLNLPNWEKSTVSDWGFFSPFSLQLLDKSSNLWFSPVISVQPFIYQVIYSYIYLKHRSIASDPGAPSSDSPFRDRAQAVPQEWGNAGQRQSLLREGWGHFSQHDSVKRVIIMW